MVKPRDPNSKADYHVLVRQPVLKHLFPPFHEELYAAIARSIDQHYADKWISLSYFLHRHFNAYLGEDRVFTTIKGRATAEDVVDQILKKCPELEGHIRVEAAKEMTALNKGMNRKLHTDDFKTRPWFKIRRSPLALVPQAPSTESVGA